MSKPNRRSDDTSSNSDVLLEQLATEIDTFEHARTVPIFDIGDRLLRAKEAAEPKRWLDWLANRVRYKERSAQRYMGAARLRAKNVRLTDLPLTRETLYNLIRYENDAALDHIVKALAKATAGGKRLTNDEALAEVECAYHFFHWQRVSPHYGDMLPRATPIEHLLGYLDEVPAEVRQAMTDKLHAMTGNAITPDDVLALYREATGQVGVPDDAPESVLVKAREAFARKPSKLSEPTLAPTMPSRPKAFLKPTKRARGRKGKRPLWEKVVRECALDLWTGDARKRARAAKALTDAMVAAGYEKVGYLGEALAIGLAQIAEREGLRFEREANNTTHEQVEAHGAPEAEEAEAASSSDTSSEVKAKGTVH